MIWDQSRQSYNLYPHLALVSSPARDVKSNLSSDKDVGCAERYAMTHRTGNGGGVRGYLNQGLIIGPK